VKTKRTSLSGIQGAVPRRELQAGDGEHGFLAELHETV